MVKDQYYNSCKNLKSFNKVFTFTKNSVANKFLENNNIKNCYIQNFSRDILKTNVDENYKTKIKLLFEKDSKLILYPGAYEERKNQKYLLQLLNGSSSLREFNWLFVGAVSDKSYLDDCMSFSIKNKLNAKFLKASIDTSYIDKLYQVCDLVFLGSIAEGMPLVLIEALSANIPWVSTDVGGVKGVLGESNTGSIIKINYTQNDAYNAIKLGLNNNILVNRRKFWEQNFNVDDVLKIYENKIQEAINDNF
jgi:glycosyltransferase involved in cell wall biosynthesis